MDTDQQRSIAIAELNPIISDIAAFSGTIEGIEVIDDETQGQLGDFVKIMNSRRKKLEDKRLSLTRPLSGVVNDINKLFKPPRDRIDELVDLAKGKMKNYAQAQMAIERARKQQEREKAEADRREAEELAEKLRKKVGAEAETTVKELETQVEKQSAKAEKKAQVSTVRGQAAAVSVPTTWKAEVVDILELCKAVAEGRLLTHVIDPNMRALNDLARETKREQTLNGVRFFEDVSVTVR